MKTTNLLLATALALGGARAFLRKQTIRSTQPQLAHLHPPWP